MQETVLAAKLKRIVPFKPKSPSKGLTNNSWQSKLLSVTIVSTGANPCMSMPNFSFKVTK
eukprot:CAMPEP_0115263792 /NCGR_PEP_ID=MMETSP0270-20121206/50096_1 /TAXON_ID=71861 /ORGANISM="Scrippsiella trochoidea, Strain CCMP3099" /LENGTH=59 /DNA_ID=CAMNT_0002679791 /DNA_START=16 /DNA_END=195 /DNA_ORIENTATION=-